MQSIRKLFDEVWLEIIKVIFVNAMLNAVIFFFVFYLVLALFDVGVMWAVYVSVAYFVYSTFRQVRSVQLHMIESSNPGLREILRTANDNMDQDNLMVRAMFRELMERMKEVSGGSFLDVRKVVVKLGLIIGMSVSVVLLAGYQVDLGIFGSPAGWFDGWGVQGMGPEAELIEDPLAARIGREDAQIQFTPNLNKIDFNKVEDVAEERRPAETFFYDDDIEGTADAPSNQKAIREAELASEYSQEVKKLG
ncbi:MAG: hypothetical protein HC945_02625 [Nitrosarchaeum sp.]|nr:hypothetical protein [Nitrosarchaeum sp.]